MKNLGLIIIALCALASVSQAEYLVNGGFETGNLTGWTLNVGGNHQAVTSFGATPITPRSGSYFDATNYRYDTNTLTQDIVGGPKQGTLTGYVYLESLDYFQAFMVTDGTNHVNAMIGYTSQYLGTEAITVFKDGWGCIGLGPTVTTGTWHKMQYVVDDSGLDFYWDDALVTENWALMTTISSIAIGGGWNTVPTGYDDFSFVEANPEPPTCAEAIGMGYGFVGDINTDCYVDLLDVKVLAQNWLRCTDPTESGCETPWLGEGAMAPLSSDSLNQDSTMAMNVSLAAGDPGVFVDGFETGTYGQWTTADSDTGHDSFMGVTITSGSGIAPRSGNFMADIPATVYLQNMYAEKVLDVAGQGALTGYICAGSWSSTNAGGLAYKSSDGVNGAAILANPYGGGTVYYQRGSSGWTSSGIVATTGVWHEIKFVVDASGVDGYWDGTALFTNYNIATKDVKTIIIGSKNSKSGHCYFDDISFPTPATQAIPPAAALPPPVLQVENNPFFVLGYFDHFVDTTPAAYDARYAAYSSQSINTVVHWGNNWNSALEYSIMAANSALAHNLKYMPQIHTFAARGDAGYPLTLIDNQVDNLWFHPAMVGWYVMDEPDISASGVYPPRLQMLYERINAHDFSHHPQFVVFATPLVEAYLRAEPPLTHDVTMNDAYPCRDGYAEFGNSMWGVATWTRQQVLQCKIAGTKQAQVNIPQACGVNGWSGFRLPTFREQRYLSYAPIVEGSRGLLWWDYGNVLDASYVQARAAYRADIIGPIATEINSLIPAIVSNSTAISVTSNRDSDTYGHGIEDVTYLLGADAQYGYLIAVNHTPNTLSSVTFTLTGAPLGPASGASPINIDVLFEDRFVSLQPGSGFTWTITDDFSPYDVNVYRLSPAPLPEDCLDVIAGGYNLVGDLDEDCHVNLQDFGWIAQDWLRCIQPDDVDCEKPWN